MKKLSPEALQVISSIRVEQQTQGTIAFLVTKHLPPELLRDPERGLLQPNLYKEVNTVLEVLGGKWNRKLQGHLFPNADAVDEALDSVVHTGAFVDAKKLFQFYETPDELADELVEAIGIKRGMRVLEPSAGHGRLIRAIARAKVPSFRLAVVELDSAKGGKLTEAIEALEAVADITGQIHAYGQDFLAFKDATGFDRVLMNPPFTKQQDAKHVRHAYELLKPSGRIAAIMSAAVKHRQTEHYEWVREHATSIKDNPEGAFKSSGTMVRTCTVIIDKPA